MLEPPELKIDSEDRDPHGTVLSLRVLPGAALAHKLAVGALFEQWESADRLIHFLLRRVITLAKDGRIDRAVAIELFGAVIDFATEMKLDIDWTEHRRELAQLGRDGQPAIERYVRPRPADEPPPLS
jgi:hypothetical protein